MQIFLQNKKYLIALTIYKKKPTLTVIVPKEAMVQISVVHRAHEPESKRNTLTLYYELQLYYSS